MTKKSINLLWLKKDLRIRDHEALSEALKGKLPIIALFCFEPEVENNYDFDLRHWQFQYHSLIEMQKAFPINLNYGSVIQVLEQIQKKYVIKNLYSHQETGNSETYERDLTVASFCKKQNIEWQEFQTNGVIRGKANRKGWDSAWIKTMKKPLIEINIKEKIFIKVDNFSPIPSSLITRLKEKNWQAGEAAAQKYLKDFLEEKVEGYFRYISQPDKARYHCSRLAPYLTWGNLSVRQVYHLCQSYRSEIKNKMSLNQFVARIKWRCHFVQKLEMQTSIEFKNLNPAFNQIRKKTNKKYLKAWKEGKTGFPLIDAAMRCVQDTGYLNFRLRSTIVSFLTHHLWQPWQSGSGYLARMFLDYEPGIHFSQFQMQAGTTGINTIRIYNPVKQSLEKDKDAVFIKEWVPELKHLPVEYIHEPWKITPMEEISFNFEYGVSYPKRIVDHEVASKHARDELWKIKKGVESRFHSRAILEKHTRPRRKRA